MGTNELTIDLSIDPDLQAMISQVLETQSGPSVTPDAAAAWEVLREVGLARLTGEEDQGGSGAGWAEAAALIRTAASLGVALPYAETDLIAGPLRRAAGKDDSSDATTAVAFCGQDGNAYNVAWAGQTDSIVFIRRAGNAFELTEAETSAVSITECPAVSEIPHADISAPSDATWAPVPTADVERAVLAGALARAIGCVGAMEGMLESAIQHTTERNQFGRALAKFQSVQNLVVDIAAETTLARAATDAALADALSENLSGSRSAFQVAVARSVVDQALGTAVRNAHQAHGAIGTTHEYTLHRRTLPALQWRSEFGSSAFWEGQLTAALLAGGTDAVWPTVTDGVELVDAPSQWLSMVCD